MVDKDTKKFNLFLISPYKVLWDFDKREKCNNIIKNLQIIFQVSELKNNYFSKLLDDELHTIELLYTKRDP